LPPIITHHSSLWWSQS